ncbi:MAG: histidine phosphotransferase family protein [Pseudomonadota bacterium]
MAESGDLRLIELVAARLCHDLVGPVGAVANGAELLAGEAREPDDEALRLIGQAARAVSARLQVFRMAFGTGNTLPASGRLIEARRLAAGLFDATRTALDWPLDAAAEAAAGRTGVKLALHLVLLAHDSLLRDGVVRVRATASPGRFALAVRAEGEAVRLAEATRAALVPGVKEETLDPRTVQAYLAARLAREAGGSLSVSPAGVQGLEFMAELPPGV